MAYSLKALPGTHATRWPIRACAWGLSPAAVDCVRHHLALRSEPGWPAVEPLPAAQLRELRLEPPDRFDELLVQARVAPLSSRLVLVLFAGLLALTAWAAGLQPARFLWLDEGSSLALLLYRLGLFALGAGYEVVGVTFECDHPPAARERRRS